MEIWIVQAGIVIAAVFIFVMIIGIMGTIIVKIPYLEVPIQIAFIVGVIVFFCYIIERSGKVERYCIYFPETEICKAVNKNPGYLTFQQKEKMVQRVKEEDNKRKDLKKIQDIEIE